MVEFLRRFPDKATRVRLKLAQILIQEQKRPAQALRVLSKIDKNSLSESLEKMRRQLERQAIKQRDEDGLVELAAEDW